MKKKISAGLLMYRIKEENTEVLLAHPGGPYFAKKDEGYWTIPKGEPDPSTDKNLFVTAVREFREETGIIPDGNFIELGSIFQKGGKEVFCWAFEYDLPENFRHSCNLIEIKWPPGSGKFIKCPEVDKLQFFGIPEAKIKIKQTQIPLIEKLENILGKK